MRYNPRLKSGDIFGRLTLIHQISRTTSSNSRYWLCACRCGVNVEIAPNTLRNGHTKSCGCLRKEIKNQQTHGESKSVEYLTWQSMKARCLNRSNENYPYYGGRGITICDRWINSFENFSEDMGQRPKGMWIERKENNSNYEPKNCIWATPTEQARNKRNSIKTFTQ